MKFVCNSRIVAYPDKYRASTQNERERRSGPSIETLYDLSVVMRSNLFVVVAAAIMLAGLANSPRVLAQYVTRDSEKVAGAKMSFEVASVKRDSNSDVNPSGESLAPTGNFFSVSKQPVAIFISIAYDRPPNGYYYSELMRQLPKWAQTERFDIQARAAGHPTKDQLHLMLRSLLADRFRLAMHYETRQGPFYNLVLVKPGKLGPNIRPFGNEEPCATSRPLSPTLASGFPTVCGAPHQLEPSQPGLVRVGFRNVTMEWFAANASGVQDRPVFDRTGLSGTFDFIIEFDPRAESSTNPTATPVGLTRIEAMRDQLGLKLEPATGPMKIFVIDHIEEPTPN